MRYTHTPQCAICFAWRWSTLFIFALAVVVIAYVTPALAQFDVLLSPQVSTLELRPGSRSGIEFEVSNQDRETPVSLQILVKDVVQGVMGEYRVSDTATGYSCIDWFVLPETTITIPAGATGFVQLGIKVPYTARGGAYGAVVFEILDTERTTQSSDGMPARFDYRFQIPAWVEIEVVRPRGSQRRLLTRDVVTMLTKDDPTMLRRYGDRSLMISVMVENTGNVHVFTEGRLLIRDEQNRLVKDTKLGSGRGAVLPGALSELMTILPLPRRAGSYTAKAFVEYGGRSPAISQATFEISPERTKLVGEQAKAQPLFVDVRPREFEESVPASGFRVMGFTVHNREEIPVDCTIDFGELRFGPEGQQWIEEDLSDATRSCVPWLSVEPTQFTIEPSRRQNVRLTLNVPEEASGGSYGAVVINTRPSRDTTEGTLPSPLYVPLYMTVPPDLLKSGEITKVDTGPDVGGSLSLLTMFRNTGNIHTIISGRVEVEHWVDPGSGTADIIVTDTGGYVDLATILLETDSTYILPGQERLITSQTLEGLPAGRYRARVIVNYGGDAPATREKQIAIKESSPLQ